MRMDFGKQVLIAVFVSATFLVTARAQTVRSGSIIGTVTDESGAVLPGVTVTVSSPALQVPQLAKPSDVKGEYAFADLPIGTYSVEYELAGFAKVVRRDVVLTTGFTARVDIALKLAAQSETVTVVGDSPPCAKTRPGRISGTRAYDAVGEGVRLRAFSPASRAGARSRTR